MFLAIIYFLMPLAISFCLIPLIKYIAKKQSWFDLPNERKVHAQPIPAIGGVAIFLGLAYALFWMPLNWESVHIYFLIPAAIIVFATGLWDDIRHLSAGKRLFVQCVIASLCFMGNCTLESDYGLFGISSFPIEIQFLASVIFIVLLINAFNLIDGINGLAGGLALMMSIIFAYLFFNAGDDFWSAIALMLAGATLGFLHYNFNEAKIFMGDNGSTFLGLMMAILFIQYTNLPSSTTDQSRFFIVGMSLLALPVLDLLRVSLKRLLKGKSPFQADQSHIHHILLRSFGTHRSATITLLFFQLFLFMLTQYFMEVCSPLTMLIIISGVYILFIQLIKIGQDLTAIKNMEQERRQLSVLH